MLQALLGNLENSQSPEQLKENLDLVQQQLDTIVNGRRDSFSRAYGGQPATTPPIQQGLTPEEQAEYNELMRQINGNAF
jgi:DNA replication initiation complex subunit (GINS family)